MKTYQNYINGKWMDSLSKETIKVEDPATTNVIGEIACAKNDDIDLAVEVAKKAFQSRILVDMPILERARLMRKIAEETRKLAKEGGTLLCYENGKQISAGISEFNSVADTLTAPKFPNCKLFSFFCRIPSLSLNLFNSIFILLFESLNILYFFIYVFRIFFKFVKLIFLISFDKV